MYNLSVEQWFLLKKYGHVEHGNERNLAAEGIYYGGDRIVAEKMKINEFLPYTIEEVIEVGLDNLQDKKIKLKNAEQIAMEIKNALHDQSGYSVIRLGDGELIFLSHDALNPYEEIQNDPRFNYLAYAGVQLPEHKLRDQLTEALLEADTLGIPISRFPTYQNLFTRLVKHHNWKVESMNLVSSMIHFDILKYTTLLDELLTNYKVLLIGNKMEEGKKHFNHLGYESIVGVIPVNGISSVSKTLEQASQFDYDVALVSAGIPANLICLSLAKEKKVAIDFGHAIDFLLNGQLQINSFTNGTVNSNNCFDFAYYYFIRDDFKMAAYWYEKIIELESIHQNHSIQNLIIAHLQLCVCHFELRDFRTAKFHNEQAIIHDPKNSSALQNKALLERILNND